MLKPAPAVVSRQTGLSRVVKAIPSLRVSSRFTFHASDQVPHSGAILPLDNDRYKGIPRELVGKGCPRLIRFFGKLASLQTDGHGQD